MVLDEFNTGADLPAAGRVLDRKEFVLAIGQWMPVFCRCRCRGHAASSSAANDGSNQAAKGPLHDRINQYRRLSPAERVVKDIRRQTRRRFSAEDKIRIVLNGLRGEDGIRLHLTGR